MLSLYQRTTRRSFLRQSSAGVGGMALAGVAPQSDVPTGRNLLEGSSSQNLWAGPDAAIFLIAHDGHDDSDSRKTPQPPPRRRNVHEGMGALKVNVGAAAQPSLGAHVAYALGSGNENLPSFVMLREPRTPAPGGVADCHAGPLPAAFGGAVLAVHADAMETAQVAGRYADSFACLCDLQEVMDLSSESGEVRSRYGIDDPAAEPVARSCLIARRLVERGVRFIQFCHALEPAENARGASGASRSFGARADPAMGRPIAALLSDLALRGRLDRTLVVRAEEVSRSPRAACGSVQGGDPRFRVWLSGAHARRRVLADAGADTMLSGVHRPLTWTELCATVLYRFGLSS